MNRTLRQMAPRLWKHKHTTTTTAALIGCAAAYSCTSPTRCDRDDFDLYLDHVTKSDLIRLFRADQAGYNVWPWIWTQPNSNGPHHVFVGPVSQSTLQQMRQLKRTVPNINLLVITDRESLEALPKGEGSLYELECGLVLDTDVALADFENKMIMLEDERIINFTKLYAN